MKQNKIIIPASVVLILIVVVFMTYDLFYNKQKEEKNIYKYEIENFKNVDSSFVKYKETSQFKPEIDKIKGIAVDNEDNIYVAGLGKVVIYNSEGEKRNEIHQGKQAFCIAVSENKNVFLSLKDHIEVWGVDSQIKKKWKVLNEKVVITSIALTDESLFAADAGNRIVYHYDLEGNLRNKIGEKDSLKGIEGFIIPSPYFDVAIGRDSEVWAVNAGRHQFEAYDKAGNLKSSWKKTSMDLEGFSGCCNPSNIALLPDGSFVTSEKGLVRVKIHNPSGEFNCVVASPKQFEKGTQGIDLAVDSKNRILVLDPKKGLVRVFEKK